MLSYVHLLSNIEIVAGAKSLLAFFDKNHSTFLKLLFNYELLHGNEPLHLPLYHRLHLCSPTKKFQSLL